MKNIGESPTGPSAPFVFKDGRVHAQVDVRVYRLSAVQKTAYRLADRCTAVLGALDSNTLPITLVFDRLPSEEGAFDVARGFFEELLDQELREKIGDETHDVRALILAHAFSRTDLIRTK